MVILGIIICIPVILVILIDVLMALEYIKADRSKATIIEYYGEDTRAIYGRRHRCTYYRYGVEFFVDGQRRTEITAMRKKNMTVGQQVEVRYCKTSEGITMVSNFYLRRLVITVVAIVIIFFALLLYTMLHNATGFTF